MMLNFAECDRARLGRDPSYDGRFFTGVRTTGVYCRPVCPAQPRSANVCYFPSAAAAELAGFRPCLRCRPETAPFCPAWKGTRATVDKALRLIVEESALDAENACVEDLADEARTRRSPTVEIVRPPSECDPDLGGEDGARSARETLTRYTELPMTEVAIQAGFRSLRRFNAVFIEVYRRSPTQARRFARAIGRTIAK